MPTFHANITHNNELIFEKIAVTLHGNFGYFQTVNLDENVKKISRLYLAEEVRQMKLDDGRLGNFLITKMPVNSASSIILVSFEILEWVNLENSD